MPPMALLVLAAHARRAGWDAKVIDQNYERIPDEIPDLACLTVWTMMAPQAYRIADAYRAQGVKVVLGGVHPSLLPTEALRHADAVVSGEADTVFATVLHDAAANPLQRLYKGSFQSMDDVPMNHEWADIIKSLPDHEIRPPQHPPDHERVPLQLRLLLRHPHQRPRLPPQPHRPGDRGDQSPQTQSDSTSASGPTSSSSTTTSPPTSTSAASCRRPSSAPASR